MKYLSPGPMTFLMGGDAYRNGWERTFGTGNPPERIEPEATDGTVPERHELPGGLVLTRRIRKERR